MRYMQTVENNHPRQAARIDNNRQLARARRQLYRAAQRDLARKARECDLGAVGLALILTSAWVELQLLARLLV